MTIGVFYFCHSWLDQESRGMQRYLVPGSRIKSGMTNHFNH